MVLMYKYTEAGNFKLVLFVFIYKLVYFSMYFLIIFHSSKLQQ